MRIEGYFLQIQKVVESCSVIQLSNVTYDKHEGCDNNIVPSAVKDLANVLKEIELLVKF